MNEKISIIMPVYNCERFVGQAIESIKRQTLKNWQLIIVNDGSTDESISEINKAILNCNEQVVLINLKENLGVANARNIALKEADGRYIAYLDSDDIWKDNKLEKQLKFMQENNVVFSYTNYSRITEKGEFIKEVKTPEKVEYKELLRNTIMLTSTIMLDTKYIEKKDLKMPNMKRSEDTQTWLNILKKNFTAYGLCDNLTEYRNRKGSTSSYRIDGLKKIWNVYRNYQKIGRIKSTYYIVLHYMNAIKKRIKITLWKNESL